MKIISISIVFSNFNKTFHRFHQPCKFQICIRLMSARKRRLKLPRRRIRFEKKQVYSCKFYKTDENFMFFFLLKTVKSTFISAIFQNVIKFFIDFANFKILISIFNRPPWTRPRILTPVCLSRTRFVSDSPWTSLLKNTNLKFRFWFSTSIFDRFWTN